MRYVSRSLPTKCYGIKRSGGREIRGDQNGGVGDDDVLTGLNLSKENADHYHCWTTLVPFQRSNLLFPDGLGIFILMWYSDSSGAEKQVMCCNINQSGYKTCQLTCVGAKAGSDLTP